MTTKEIRGVHVFWGIATFFALIIAADTYFVVRAVGSFPGEEVKNSYVLGLDYNREVERRARQDSLGWKAEAGLVAENGQMLIVHMETAAGAPVSGLAVTARARLIGKSGDGQAIDLPERSPGEYAAPLSLGGRGRVELTISARHSAESDPVFEAAKTVVIS